MTFQGDPYRELGVAPGASLNEIRSAYRRLAKKYHPDAAGDRALPRFLSIQAAYERLVDSEGRLRPVTGAAGAARRGSEAWRADPAKARASREAWRARRAGGTTAGAPRPGPRPAADGSAKEAPPREKHTRRGSRKATPGSTTYDEAAETPLDPAWEGGAWYGPSSQTYWTINPREYADPRKHGPEYLARARRAAQQEAGPEGSGAADATAAADAGSPSWGFGGGSTTTDGDGGWGTHGWAYEEAADAADPGARNPTGRPDTAGAWATPTEPLPDLEAVARRAAPRNLLALARRPDRRWRLLVALLAWPPVGYGVGTLLATSTGCAQFSAACPEPLPLLSLAVQPLVIAALFAVPPAAAVGAFAALVALAVAIAVATVLSVSPGPSGSVGTGILGVAVTVAYFVAMVGGAVAVWRPRPDGDAGARRT
jgi:curved DNA-binding protein CbpA